MSAVLPRVRRSSLQLLHPATQRAAVLRLLLGHPGLLGHADRYVGAAAGPHLPDAHGGRHHGGARNRVRPLRSRHLHGAGRLGTRHPHHLLGKSYIKCLHGFVYFSVAFQKRRGPKSTNHCSSRNNAFNCWSFSLCSVRGCMMFYFEVDFNCCLIIFSLLCQQSDWYYPDT